MALVYHKYTLRENNNPACDTCGKRKPYTEFHPLAIICNGCWPPLDTGQMLIVDEGWYIQVYQIYNRDFYEWLTTYSEVMTKQKL